MEQQERIFRIIQTEYYIKHFALYRSPNVSSSDSPMQEKYTYHVDSTGATITAECCVNLIRKYCEKLPKDRYTYLCSTISSFCCSFCLLGIPHHL
jgi:endoribonuclease Dicer